MSFDFDNSYSRLPEAFYRRIDPAPVKSPRLIAFNRTLAASLRMRHAKLDNLQLAALFAGNQIPAGAEPLATAYAGHQFGHFVPQLGDGRAILLGEVVDAQGVRRDIQLKGSGRTPFSRGGDGRAALGPVIREYIVSEAMHALGIPTTRALALVTTGEPVYRETPMPGAVLVRVAASHIRIGTFQYFAVRGDEQAVRLLAEYAINRLYPEARDTANPYLSLLEHVVKTQAALMARWMQVGFIHGVMNTDNMALSGETLDYGPCAFMDRYDPVMVFSSIDAQGRYAFTHQPAVAQWNLTRLAETLLPFMHADRDKAVQRAADIVSQFPQFFKEHWLAGMCRKIGLSIREEGAAALVEGLLNLMHEAGADYTLTFRRLCTAIDPQEDMPLFMQQPVFEEWLQSWRARLAHEPQPAAQRRAAMRSVNPAYIPRNHRVEEAIRAAVDEGDFTVMESLGKALATPYEEKEAYEKYALPPLPEERVYKTFCGT